MDALEDEILMCFNDACEEVEWDEDTPSELEEDEPGPSWIIARPAWIIRWESPPSGQRHDPGAEKRWFRRNPKESDEDRQVCPICGTPGTAISLVPTRYNYVHVDDSFDF